MNAIASSQTFMLTTYTTNSKERFYKAMGRTADEFIERITNFNKPEKRTGLDYGRSIQNYNRLL